MHIARRLSFTISKRVLSETSNPVRGGGSNIKGLRGRSSSVAASVPCDDSTPKSKQSRKRVSKDERHAMVESFVHKYRALNSGKFPTASDARKEVGGSYYVIRKIVQELEHKSRISTINTRNETLPEKVPKESRSSIEVEQVLRSLMAADAVVLADTKASNGTSLGKEVAKENQSSTEVQEVVTRQMTVDEVEVLSHKKKKAAAEIHKIARSVAIKEVDIGDSNCKDIKVKEEPQTSILFEKTSLEEVAMPKTTGDNPEHVAAQSHLIKVGGKEFLHSCREKPVDNIKEKTCPEEILDLEDSKPKDEQQRHSPELDKFGRDLSKEHADDEGLQRKSSIWGNLKSLADGFINIWRKL